MNYRHAFHAGNFADLAKHAVLAALLRELTARPAALTVIDTHAGAGLYDLAAEASRRTGEGEAGVARLMADPAAPAAFDDLRAAVRRVNDPGKGRWYPGSPVLIAAALRPRDRGVFCELRDDDTAALKRVLPRELGALVHRGDGWAEAVRAAPAAPAALLVLVDPPFERGDDYVQAARLTARLLKVNRGAVIAIWAPLKDLATFDAFLGDVEDAARAAPILAAEVRLRPLTDPMRLNGCAMIVINPPPALEDPARAVVAWIARTLGEEGALGRVTLLPGGEGGAHAKGVGG
ncbi:MAG TPA: 23S rRNA (adenine(2030)-N(6))-methyltransferase RlmJ [Caulobacteraceae bacterium]|nr:23S rRNA (adenine(2030)-N(6))-methyltransferase RlmJ [Caulobacteraceae bacterium]